MRPACLTLVAATLAGSLTGGEWEILEDRSLLAVVTHRAGFLAGKAHDHLIVATEYRAALLLDRDDLTRSRFEVTLRAADLTVDDPGLQGRWFPHLERLGILDEPFRGIDDKDRQKVRATMLSGKQLDAEQHAEIVAEVVRLEVAESLRGAETFDHAALLALTVRGRTIERRVAVRCRFTGGRVEVEGVGTFRFTDFGIPPFSAFLGAVKNEDTFHLVLHLEALLADEAEGREESATASESRVAGLPRGRLSSSRRFALREPRR